MDTGAAELFASLSERADGELLTAWDATMPELDSAPVKALESAGLLFTYRAGRPRCWHAYLVGLYQPGDITGPGSVFPPPSLQAGPTWVMYARRDRGTCHLCGGPVTSDWRQPHEFHSLDHFIPRSKGGGDFPSNIRLAHASCNRGRRARDVAEFRAWLAVNRPGRALAAAGGT